MLLAGALAGAGEADNDGIVGGKVGAADLFFLIACILFAIAFVIALVAKPIPIDKLLIRAAWFCIALAWLLL